MKQEIVNQIEEIRSRIRSGDYSNPEEKHELHTKRWMLQKQLDGITVPPLTMPEAKSVQEK